MELNHVLIILLKSLCKALMHGGGFIKELIGNRLMTFGDDGAFIFQGIRLHVT
jgi:hypothetical protein